MQKKFSISGGGVVQVKSHSCSKIHSSRIKRDKDSHYLTKIETMWNLNQSKINLSHEEQVRKAEIIQGLKSVEFNYSFASANGDVERFK